MTKDKQFKLCYVDENVMYFTDNFEHQWGDDWNDAPYECNAEPPYEWIDEWSEERNLESRGHIRYIGYMTSWDIKTPNRGYLNSPYSVEQINKGAVPWLYCDDAGGLMGGATIDEAIEWLKKAGLKWGELK